MSIYIFFLLPVYFFTELAPRSLKKYKENYRFLDGIGAAIELVKRFCVSRMYNFSVPAQRSLDLVVTFAYLGP